jgi:hypothetical protein
MSEQWPIRITGLTFEDPSSLLANPKNNKIHPQRQQTVLRAALKEVGWIAGVIQNDVTGHLIDGHDRAENAISTGQKSIPVLHCELTEDQEDLALLTFDSVGQMSIIDQQKTNDLIEGLRVSDEVLSSFLAGIYVSSDRGDSDGLNEISSPSASMPGEHVCPECGARFVD